MKTLIFTVLFFLPLEGVSSPEWTKTNTLKRSGAILTAICTGNGPSQALSRKDALNSCRATAADQANNGFKVNSVYIQTEKDHGFQEEVSSHKIAKDLPCMVKAEYLEEINDTFKSYLKCEFDLSKAKVLNVEEIESNTVTEDSKQLILLTIPMADSLLVQGKNPRIIPIRDNPQGLPINAGDSFMVIRKAGYLPKRIKMDGLPAILEVQLDSF